MGKVTTVSVTFFYLPLPCARRGDVRVKKSGFEIWPKQMANF